MPSTILYSLGSYIEQWYISDLLTVRGLQKNRNRKVNRHKQGRIICVIYPKSLARLVYPYMCVCQISFTNQFSSLGSFIDLLSGKVACNEDCPCRGAQLVSSYAIKNAVFSL